MDLHGADPILALGAVLIAGICFGAIARGLRLPSVTGQILAGVLIGPHVLDVLAPEDVESLEPVTHFALGLMAVAVGAHLSLRRMRNAGKRLALLVLFEATLAPAIVGVALLVATPTSAMMAVLLATLAVSTAPATIVALVRESRAEGVFVKTLIGAVALNNVACIVGFEVARAIARAELVAGETPSWQDVMLAPATQVVLAGLIGGGVGWIAHEVTRGVRSVGKLGSTAAVAVLLTVGLARFADVSPLLAGVALGFVQTNLTPRREKIADKVFGNLEPAILAVFFTLAGMHLNFDHAAEAGLVGAVFFIARAFAKWIAADLAMRLAGATKALRNWMGLALLPQAGVAIGLVILVQDDPAFADLVDVFVAVVLTVVTLNEIVGPILTRIALARSGEQDRDRPRLLDFIGEQNIVTDLVAKTKEEALTRLTDLLIQTHHLRDVDRNDLLASVLEREDAESTAVGAGLAIPHGVLRGATRMAGVMAISSDPLPFEPPDGEPVRCVVLLATPEEERQRHLQVLAALARSIGRDEGMRDRLYNARTAAHAYEILHGSETEEFNVYLERDAKA